MAKSESIKKKKICKAEGCGRDHIARGYCVKHYSEIKRTIGFPPIPKQRCSVPGCTREYHANGYCSKHNHHMDRFGTIRERTRKDPNVFLFDSGVCEIYIFDGAGKPKATAFVDRGDYDLVKPHKWGINDSGYPICWKLGDSYKFLHHHIMGTPAGRLEIDHKDGNPLNNRRSNLRFATSSQNKMNMKVQSGTKSGFKGVSIRTDGSRVKRYRAYIKVKDKIVTLGNFKYKIDAAIAYNEAASEYFGEFARLNEV